jgi:hypothetical protein
MARSGARLFKKIRTGKSHQELSEEDWTNIEKLLKSPLPEKSRRDIEIATFVYSAIGPLHSSDQTVNLNTAKSALDAWLKASGRFRLKLGEKTSPKKMGHELPPV